MKRLILLVFVLAACGKPPVTETSNTVVTAPGQDHVTTIRPVEKPKGNPNRVYQLDTLKRVSMTVKGKPIKAWVMDDEGKTQEGMMFLTDKEVKPDEGMLFVFDSVQPKLNQDGSPRGFWMHNTLIPLDIVFLTTKGKVLNVGHGKVQDDTVVPAAGDFQYVLEMKAGTAARLGLKPGDTIPIPKL